MTTIVRVMLLGTFASVGLGLAVSVSSQVTPASRPIESADTTARNATTVSRSEAPRLSQSSSASQAAGDRSAREASARTLAATTLASDGREQIAPPPPTPAAVPAPSLSPPRLISAEIPSWVDVYQPRMANQIEQALKAIEQVEASQRATADVVNRLRSELPKAAPPAPEADVPAESVQATVTAPRPRVQFDADDHSLEIAVQGSDIREVLKLLGQAGGVNILASPNVTGTVSATLSGVSVEEALQAVLKANGFVFRREGNIIYVGNQDDLKGIGNASALVGMRIFRPSYIAAAELQKLLAPLLTEGVSSITVSSPAETGLESDSNKAGGDSYTGDEVVLVRDYEPVLQELEAIVAQVDRMPRQVAIEATIISVRLDDEDVLGVDFELLRQKDTIRLTSGTPLTTLAAANFQDGLKIGFLDSSLFVFLEALESIGETNVVAAPRVLCLNKQRAEILIGSELGYVNTTVTQTSTTQAVEFLEVGTHLRIRPFIAEDGMVRMEVHPELSTGSVRVEQGLTLPDKDVTQVTTNVMCRSGATVVIGGLIREDLISGSSQIPVLGNLPVVGVAFRKRTEEIDRREIIVLLTPRVLDEFQAGVEGAHSSADADLRRDMISDKMTPFGKRALGERYARLGQAAWNAGDADTALRYANWAIHFDPMNMAAIRLREEAHQVAPEAELSVRHHLRHGLPAWESPSRDYSAAGYPWRPAPIESAPPHFYLEHAAPGEELPPAPPANATSP